MYDITLVFTHHSELGKCNSDELYKIIESIKPDVIFDELPLAEFNMFYSDSFEIYQINKRLLNQNAPEVPLEVKCIKKYKQYYDVEVFPVDIDVRQRLAEYQDDFAFMCLTFFKNEEYQKLDNENDLLTRLEGFHYLNSDKFLEFLDRKTAMEKDIIEAEIEKSRLFNIYHLFQAEQYDNRENAMLDNIYYYSKEIQYKQAVFLIGAGHRKSIMQKIASLEKPSAFAGVPSPALAGVPRSPGRCCVLSPTTVALADQQLQPKTKQLFSQHNELRNPTLSVVFIKS